VWLPYDQKTYPYSGPLKLLGSRFERASRLRANDPLLFRRYLELHEEPGLQAELVQLFPYLQQRVDAWHLRLQKEVQNLLVKASDDADLDPRVRDWVLARNGEPVAEYVSRTHDDLQSLLPLIEEARASRRLA